MDSGKTLAFGDLLRHYRDAAGLTQEELAERAGLSLNAIGLLERRARHRPRAYTVNRLAEALALDAADRTRFESAARQLGGAPSATPEALVRPVQVPLSLAAGQRLRDQRRENLSLADQSERPREEPTRPERILQIVAPSPSAELATSEALATQGRLSTVAPPPLRRAPHFVRWLAVTAGAGVLLFAFVLGNRLLSSTNAPAVAVSTTTPADPPPLTAGAWTAASAMATVRGNPTITLLANGMALVAGGDDRQTAFASAELFDPTTMTWSRAGTMAFPRTSHTATLLDSGKVLVVGGYAGYARGLPALATAELYDPAANTWTGAGTLATGRYNHAAVLLRDGKVLVTGGRSDASGTAGAAFQGVASAEIYDPLSNSWADAGSMATVRAHPTATVLKDGSVLVAGGSDGRTILASAELYDPGTGRWATASSMAHARNWHTATRLSDGKVLVVGGYGNASDIPFIAASAELYDPATKAWTDASPVVTPRAFHVASLLSSGKVLVTGGSTTTFIAVANSGPPVVAAELYNPATNAWTGASRLATARTNAGAALLSNGKVLVAGGYRDQDTLASVELYDPNGRAEARPANQDATEYLQSALDWMQANSLLRDQVNWEQVRHEAVARAANARTTADTYAAIRYALDQIRDPRSAFLDPDQEKVFEQFQPASFLNVGIQFMHGGLVIGGLRTGGPAENSGLHAGDVLESLNDRPIQSITDVRGFDFGSGPVRMTFGRPGQSFRVNVTFQPAAIPNVAAIPIPQPDAHRLDEEIGYVRPPVFDCAGETCNQIATALQQAIRGLDESPTCGWVVDLRHGHGWTNVLKAGLGPLLWEGDLSTSVVADGHQYVWSYSEGKVFISDGAAKILQHKVDAPYHLKSATGVPPVAVLTGPDTVTAFEWAVVDFRGRVNTRTFGEPTFGNPVGLQGKRFSDGAQITLTGGVTVDRTGRVYRDKIPPDQFVANGTAQSSNEQDPVVRAAVEWLRGQGCAAR